MFPTATAQAQPQVSGVLKNLLRTLRQPDQHDTLKTQLSDLLASNALSPTQAYQQLLEQALRTIPSPRGAPDGAAKAGFTNTMRRADGSVIPPPSNPMSVHDLLLVTLQEGILGVIPPLLDQLQQDEEEQDENTVTSLLADYLLLFAAYRRPDGIRELFQLVESSGQAELLEEMIDRDHDRYGTALRIAATVGAVHCVELLLIRDANPNRYFTPMYAQYTLSILQSVLQVLQHDVLHSTEATEEVEAMDMNGVLDALLNNGAQVKAKEAQAAMQVKDVITLQRILKAGIQQQTLSKDDLTELAPTAIVMNAKDNSTTTSRLAPLLQNGVDPNQLLDDLSVPWGLSKNKKDTSLMEIAIQSKDVAGLQSLRSAGGSLLQSGALDRVLCSPLTEGMMVALEEALEEELKLHDAPTNFLRPPTTTIQAGHAWVGNVPDFENYLRQKKQPMKLPKLDPQLEAVMKARREKDAKNKFPDMPAENGDWIALTPLPTLQVVFHVNCPDDYLIGALAGAMYGGFKDGEWNPLHPPESDIIFTGRMAYSEEDPRHITWFLDAMAVGGTEPTQAETHILESLKEAQVPDGTVLDRLRSVTLVGSWENITGNHAIMWTCQQEYRYGIMAGGKVFMSVGYEAMDLKVETMAAVLDTAIRAKLQYHRNATDANDKQKPFFLRTPLSATQPHYLEKVPKKRTPSEIFEYLLQHGEKYTGIDLTLWGRPFPPKEETRRFAPQYRIFDVETLNMMLKHKFDCSLAKQLEQDVALLVDELLMMFLYEEIVPTLKETLKGQGSGNGVDEMSKAMAETLFPNHSRKNTVDFQCYQRLVPSSIVAEASVEAQGQAANPPPAKGDSGVSSDKLTALEGRISAFLVAHLVSFSSEAAQLPILKDQGFLARLYSVCEYLVLETLELANNGRRDAYFPSMVPRHVRWSVSMDSELTEVFHLEHVMEFFYPAHNEEVVESEAS